MLRYLFVFLGLILVLKGGIAQPGGRSVYEFLNLSASARLNAIGGINVSLMDEDPTMGLMNPALIADTAHRRLALTFSPYLANISFGYAGYSHTFDKIGSFHTGFFYLNSGKMTQADEFGNELGEFSASELLWVIGYSRAWKQFRYGANLKVISSNLAPGFSSFGLALDLGGSYHSKDRLFSAGIVVRNIGTQLSTYAPGGPREPLPFEIVAGISNKFKYMPLRFSVTLIQLQRPELIYVDPNQTPEFDLSGQPIPPPNRTADKIFTHFVFAGELLLGKALRLRMGYNHLRRTELRSENRAGLSGFSLGAGIRTRYFNFDYGFAAYGVSGPFQTHQFSLNIKV